MPPNRGITSAAPCRPKPLAPAPRSAIIVLYAVRHKHTSVHSKAGPSGSLDYSWLVHKLSEQKLVGDSENRFQARDNPLTNGG